ncbi:MAG: hypothetical protein ABIK42_04610, partial [candidate division WOR-3 bacterium]
MRAEASRRKKVLWLFLAGLALGFAFAPFSLRFLSFFALVPLFWVVENSRRVFFWGWLFGFFAAGFHLWWLWFLVVPLEPITRLLLNLGVVLLFGYLGLYFGLFAYLVRKIGFWSAPLILPILEFVKSRTQIGFPWDLLGVSLTPWTVFIQGAALGGVFILSAWLVLVNLLIYRLIFRKNRTGYLIGLVLAFLVPLCYGLLRIKENKPWFEVAIVQPNVSPLDKGDWNSRARIQADLLRLTKEAQGSKPDLVIFPETATLV